MNKYLSEPSENPAENIYDLYGVINHFGSLNFGHYTANCYNEEAKSWFNFNDSSVTKISDPGSVNGYSQYGPDDIHNIHMTHEEEHLAQISSYSKQNHDSPYIKERIVTPAAYVLFYMRRGLTLNTLEDFKKIKITASDSADYIFEQAKLQDEAEASMKKGDGAISV